MKNKYKYYLIRDINEKINLKNNYYLTREIII